MNRRELFSARDLARLDRLRLQRRRMMPGDRLGDWLTGRIGAGGHFADYREYIAGDDLRYLDWNVYGRLGDLVVKRFEAEENMNLLLLVDRSASMEGAKDDLARRLAGALAYIALAHLEHVRLGWLPALPGTPVDIHRGRARAGTLLRNLASTPIEGPTDHGRDVARVIASQRKRGVAIVCSDFFDPANAVAGLSRLHARGYEVAALHILDPKDVELPIGASIHAEDAETGETIPVDVTLAFLTQLRETWQRHSAMLQRWCNAHEVLYQRVDVRHGFWDSLKALLRRGVVSGVHKG